MAKDVRRALERGEPRPVPPELSAATAPDRDRQLLAAIVEGSHDAIVTKDLSGIITSWNRGAERVFGYSAEEAVGAPILMLIPEDRQGEEPEILERIRRGERVEHYETIRRRKDGRAIHISLAISPLRDEDGRVVGASKIARDITERHLAQEQQRLLLGEMQHRIKNVFALAESLINLCAARTETPAQLAEMARGRLQALARAHALTVPQLAGEAETTRVTTLRELVSTLAGPFMGDETERLRISGDDVPLSTRAVAPLALVINELLTNAAKHGALRDSSGRIEIDCSNVDDRIVLQWEESGPRRATSEARGEGFGTRLSDVTARGQLGGGITREWTEHGLLVRLIMAAESVRPEERSETFSYQAS